MKGWLDNFGKADNANDSNVSLPEGFVGVGYDTKGRNYSPAWGGQFAMGGSIPGSVGFTYARTAGAAPSNGPYAKKTKASAQKGKQVQKGVDSTLENIFEIVDPTGVSSWDDVYQSYQKSGMSPETKFEIFGALPILGKVGKAGKLLGPALSAGQANKRIKTNANVVSNVLQSIPYVGRGTDATQAIQQASSVPFFPSAPPAEVGQFGMYAGMPAFNKKEYGGEIPSAQSGIMTPMLLGRKILSYLYPSEEAASTVAAAPVEYKKGLTDELLKRQAYKESTFNPAAVSPAGYKGLTQIGEEVISDYSKKKGGKKLDPFNPKDAVELQKFAMDDLYNASFINKPNQPDSVRIAKTLAAYNWGRGNLFNYLNEQKQKGVDIYGSYDWLNDLPKETSDYVNKILLQEDQSFNKNYKRDSTNPKYKNVTSLYDKKKFGGKVTTAQNGQEMKFYQNGLDWKPKSMQEGGKIYEGQELPEFVVEGKDERIKEAMSQGINKFYRHVGELMGAPQKEMMQLITGKEQTPSEAFGFQNTGGWLDNYSSFGKNLSNLAMDAVLDPVNLIGVGIADDIARTTLKGASKKLASSADDVSKSFKSEIDWAKWNPDTPKYPELIKEYNKIEEATKKAGTWMQNPDGSVFKGTPEQFIQQQSSYFKKAYPKGYNEVYRGVSANTSFPNFNESADPGLRGPRGIFTANKELASNYVFGPQGWQEEKRILTPFDPDNTPGLFELIYPKGKQITRYQNLDDWTNIDLARTPTKEDIKYNIDNIKSQLERRKKITDELSSTEGMSAIADQAKMEIKSQEDRIKQLQKYYDNFDKVINDEAEFNKMKKALGEQTTTDTIAKYIPKTNLRSVTLQDLIDSGQGDVTIVNNRPGNYLKSMVGNVGFFDLKNPNIYKGIVPAGIATSLTFDQQKNGGEVKQFQDGGVEKISINDPRYPELYKNRQVGLSYDGIISLPDLPEVTVTAPRSYTMDSLRDFTTAALYGAPATAMKLSMVPQAAMTEGIEALRGKPYDFSNAGPNLGYFGSNQRDLSQTMGYENPQGFLQNAANVGLSMIDPLSLIGAGAADDIIKGGLKGIRQKAISQARSPQMMADNVLASATPNASTAANQAKPRYAELVHPEMDLLQKLKQETIERLDTPEGRRRLQYMINKNFGVSHKAWGKPVEGWGEFFLHGLKSGELSGFKKLTPDDIIEDFRNLKFVESDDPFKFDKMNAFAGREGGWEPGSYPVMYMGQDLTPKDIKHVFQHEIGHHLQRNVRPTNLDDRLSKLELKKQPSSSDLNPLDEILEDADPSKVSESWGYGFDPALNYFNTGSRGMEKLPYAAEVRESLLRRGKIKNYYDEITPQMLEDHYDLYNKTGGNKYKLRLYEIMEKTPKNFKILSETLNNLPALTLPIAGGAAATISALQNQQPVQKQKNGGITKDNLGYWNPDNWGKPVEIGSNNITMEGVYEPLLGVSDTGDTKLMQPGKNYKFKGKKVTEFPVAELGINQLDAQPMKKLNQLLNFTNNPDKDNWLDKYN